MATTLRVSHETKTPLRSRVLGTKTRMTHTLLLSLRTTAVNTSMPPSARAVNDDLLSKARLTAASAGWFLGIEWSGEKNTVTRPS